MVDGFVDTTLLTVVMEDGLRAPSFEVRAGILGASHWLEVRRPGAAPVSEVLACTDLAAPASPARRLYSGGVAELAAPFECELGEGVVYRFHSAGTRTQDARARLR